MITFEPYLLKKPGNVNYFAARYEGKKENEPDTFFSKVIEEVNNECLLLMNIITSLKIKGVEKEYCRHEDEAKAFFPPKWAIKNLFPELNTEDFKSLRIYFYYLNRSNLVFFNGCIKTSNSPIDCPNCNNPFREAKRISRLIDNSILVGDINPVNFELDILKIRYDV